MFALFDVYQRIPWVPRALLTWLGTLSGIALAFLASRADWATHHSMWESLGVMAGWFTAMGCPVILMISRSPWDE